MTVSAHGLDFVRRNVESEEGERIWTRTPERVGQRCEDTRIVFALTMTLRAVWATHATSRTILSCLGHFMYTTPSGFGLIISR